MCMLCIKAHYKLKIKIFFFICILFDFVLIKDNHGHVYLRFVAVQLQVCDCNQLQHSNCSLRLEKSEENFGFMYAALENLKTIE